MAPLTTLPAFVALAILSNGLLFVLAGGLLHRAYYVKRASEAHLWRIQSDKPLPTREEMKAKLRAVLPNMLAFNGIIGIALWAVFNGYSRVVFDTSAYGLPLLVFTSFLPPVIFHVLAFLVHRLYHTAFFFKHIHYVHHKARTPTFVDGLAMHPIEVVTSALVLVSPAFIVPVHIAAFGLYLTLVGVHELLDHSGIRLQIFPMSASTHHDEHHRVVRRCYAQTFTWLDDLFGTGLEEKKRGSV
jgi:lathosterol oxidase